jgi:RNA polymerase sigma-70 factor (ECF subfamily)
MMLRLRGIPMADINREHCDERLSRLSTWWTLLRQSGAAGPTTITNAQHQLVERYSGAVYRYLLGAVRNEDAAKELFQEFALRFLQGDYRRADPNRGRFRDYLKSALSHLVTDHHRMKTRQPGSLPATLAAPQELEDDSSFAQCWREELLNQTWKALEKANPDQHAVLLALSKEPDLSAAELAERSSQALGRPISQGNARVLLHRAREKFAELLLAELRLSLDQADDSTLRAELRELGLAGLCEHHVEAKTKA